MLFAILLLGLASEFEPVLAGGKQGTNIVMTKDMLVLNDGHKKNSNNIVIKDKEHHQQHHCNCHEHHVFVPMHHWGHHDEHWGHWNHHHKRSDSGGHDWWGDMQLAASNQMAVVPGHLESDQFDGQAFNKEFENPDQAPFLQGSSNEALNSLIKQRYMNPVAQPPPPQQYNQFNSEGLHKISYPVFVKDDQN